MTEGVIIVGEIDGAVVDILVGDVVSDSVENLVWWLVLLLEIELVTL